MYEPPNAEVIAVLGNAVHYSRIDQVPELVVRVVDGEMWREFDSKMGTKNNQTFEEFVESAPLKGIGTSMERLKRICAGDARALDAIDRATQRPHGGARESGSKNDNVSLDYGNSTDQAIRRLRKDRPDLHAQVLDGDLSPHAAMVEAGFRRRTASFPIDDIDRLASGLRRRLDADDIDQLIKLLAEGADR